MNRKISLSRARREWESGHLDLNSNIHNGFQMPTPCGHLGIFGHLWAFKWAFGMCVILRLLALFSAFLPTFLSLAGGCDRERKKYILKQVCLWRAQFTFFLFLLFGATP